MSGPPPGSAGAPTPSVLPLLVAAVGSAAWIGMDTTIKGLSPHYGPLQLTFFRFASGLVFAALIWAGVRSPMPTRGAWRLHLARSGLLLVTLTSYFYALSTLPLAQAVAISYMAPIFISLMAMAFLGERPSPRIWVALALGLAGTVVALWPELREAANPRLLGLAAAAFSAVAFGGVMVLARVQAQRDALWTIVLLQNLLPAVALAGPAAATWQPMQPGHVAPIALAGALATVGLLCITWAFRHAEASRVAPVEYVGLVWAGLLGYLVFGEVPTAWTLASAALIVAGCLWLLRR